MEAQQLQAHGEYEALIGRIKLETPEYVSLISVDPLSLADVQQKVLDRQTTLIEYFVMDGQILAWIIDTEPVRLWICRYRAINSIVNFGLCANITPQEMMIIQLPDTSTMALLRH